MRQFPVAEPRVQLFMTFDNHDQLLISGSVLDAVQVFLPDGTHLYNIGQGVLKEPAGLCVDSENHAFVCDVAVGHERVYAFSL